MITLLEAGLLVFIVLSALMTAILRDVLAAIIVFGAYSLGMAVLWIVLRAPDVGLTEAAVGAGIMTVLLLVSIARTTRLTGIELRPVEINWGVAALCGLFVLAILATVPALPDMGQTVGNPVFGEIYNHYVTMAYEQTHVENVVTAILVAYRGFDTLGEATVVFTAGVAVLTVLRREVDA
ncbi:monovalent cation/H+ antiporter subunit B [Halovivax asiaticus JCM 14624]|uniref:Monovalent cation/H+ antiporter subunit B n=1 Tax=Halovivax asiaticus JCM 14624 TaxID=1227490 RepID=M0BUW9_9EURY|nr:DUF4040 domain-containing protein [Halovivax asiaticus]ELZ14193.1 monovalent cation/H+ antiporter subunit B [Halovivax asiaticus JCM 14624]